MRSAVSDPKETVKLVRSGHSRALTAGFPSGSIFSPRRSDGLLDCLANGTSNPQAERNLRNLEGRNFAEREPRIAKDLKAMPRNNYWSHPNRTWKHRAHPQAFWIELNSEADPARSDGTINPTIRAKGNAGPLARIAVGVRSFKHPPTEHPSISGAK